MLIATDVKLGPLALHQVKVTTFSICFSCFLCLAKIVPGRIYPCTLSHIHYTLQLRHRSSPPSAFSTPADHDLLMPASMSDGPVLYTSYGI